MLEAGKKIPPHISARQQLQSLIATISASGTTRLPPERDLCAALGVSLITVQKAIRQLTIEGRIVSIPRKGRFIRPGVAATNIGIIVGEGSVSTFLMAPDILGDILDVFNRRNCYVRLIQLSRPQDAPELLRQYKFDGCVWYLPLPSLFPKISKIMENCHIPVVVPVLSYTPADAASLPPGHFTNDFAAVGRVRAEYLLKRGHRKIAHCVDPNSGTCGGFMSALESAGIKHNPAWDIPKTALIAELLPGILDAGEVTAIISEGGIEQLEEVFRILDGHPWCRKGELLVDFVGGSFTELTESYPGIKVTAVNFYPHKEIGRGAAEALVDAIRNKLPIQSVKYSSRVKSPDWSSFQPRLTF